jgi:hypothetical protein
VIALQGAREQVDVAGGHPGGTAPEGSCILASGLALGGNKVVMGDHGALNGPSEGAKRVQLNVAKPSGRTRPTNNQLL